MEHHMHHAQPVSVQAEFGRLEETEGVPVGPHSGAERHYAQEFHGLAGGVASAIVLLSIIFAAVVYWEPYQVLDPAETKEQWPRLHAFLAHKWYFDELYSAILVRPALVVAYAARWFDTHVIDGVVNGLGRCGVLLSRWNGIFDARIIDGLVNVLADACYGLGARLRGVQTGYLRSYVLFLALAAVAIFVVLTYFVTRALAG